MKKLWQEICGWVNAWMEAVLWLLAGLFAIFLITADISVVVKVVWPSVRIMEVIR